MVLFKPRRRGQRTTTRHRWPMHSHQAAVFASTAKYTVVVAGRRGGKSEVEVMWLLAKAGEAAMAGKQGVCWVVMPTYTLARVLWRKLHRLAPPGWVTDKWGTDQQPGSVEILGRVVIEFKSAERPESLVSEGLLALLVDEAGIVKERAWTESLQPTLLDHDAPALLGGTPKGRNWFHRLFLDGFDPLKPRVQSYRWSSFANPFISRTAIEDLASSMPERMYRQEILAEFLTDEGAVFRGVREWVVPELSTAPTTSIGVDLAKRQDFTVVWGIDAENRPTYFDRFNSLSWTVQRAAIRRAAETLKRRHLVIDATGVGDPVVDDLRAEGLDVTPFTFTATTKEQLVDRLAVTGESRRFWLPDEPVAVNEFEIYGYDQRANGRFSYSAPEGAHDDCVMAAGLALWGQGTRVPEQTAVHY